MQTSLLLSWFCIMHRNRCKRRARASSTVSKSAKICVFTEKSFPEIPRTLKERVNLSRATVVGLPLVRYHSRIEWTLCKCNSLIRYSTFSLRVGGWDGSFLLHAPDKVLWTCGQKYRAYLATSWLLWSHLYFHCNFGFKTDYYGGFKSLQKLSFHCKNLGLSKNSLKSYWNKTKSTRLSPYVSTRPLLGCKIHWSGWYNSINILNVMSVLTYTGICVYIRMQIFKRKHWFISNKTNKKD